MLPQGSEPTRTLASGLDGRDLELDFDVFAIGGVLDLEELTGGEAAGVGHDRVREDLDLRVVGLDIGVVDPA
jgi:hypothetical protein